MYETEEGETLSVALKRKHVILQQELDRFKDLFRLLREKTDLEALEILRRIRRADEPLAVLDAIKQAEILIPDPSSNARVGDPVWMRLDQSALGASIIKVPARPWTAVAEDGLVSDLSVISSLGMEPTSSIGRPRSFLDHMRRGDPKEASCCSPLLVNPVGEPWSCPATHSAEEEDSGCSHAAQYH